MDKNVILDCDPGHDDAIAIILAASKVSPLTIEAITTVAGNVEVEKNTLNTLKVCDIIDLNDVPVAQGSKRPLVKEPAIAGEIHGETGLDGPNLPDKPSREPVGTHAVDVIIEKVLNAQEAITLVATGPLTNIALAMIKEPSFVPNIKEIVLMGGGTFGNWTPAAEFNIWVDAEAAKVVFDSGVPIAMFGLDVTHKALATEDRMHEFSQIHNPVARFVVELLEFFGDSNKEMFGFEGPPIHDACTIAYLIDPSIFDLDEVSVEVETKGDFTYGMTVVAPLGTTSKDPNVHFANNIDADKFWSLMVKALESYE